MTVDMANERPFCTIPRRSQPPEGNEIDVSVSHYIDSVEVSYLLALIQSAVAVLQETPQEIPRAFVVLDNSNAIHHIVDFVQ